MSGFESNKKMDMIRHSTDALWCAAQAFHRTAKILVETWTPFGGYDGFSIFRGKDEMVKE